jgi:hypothetical protein
MLAVVPFHRRELESGEGGGCFKLLMNLFALRNEHEADDEGGGAAVKRPSFDYK